MLRWIASWILILPSLSRALDVRPGLTDGDRTQVVRVLGLNSQEKILSNPYPLGGFDGLEIGYSIEMVDVHELRRLGCTPGSTGGCPEFGDDTEWRYSRLTVGKGLYNNIDLFFSLMAPIGDSRTSDYGGILRWSFYQAEFLPINFSLLVQANQFNYADTFMDRNLGAELMAGVNVDNFAMYFGGGLLESTGTFDASVVDPNDPDLNGDTRTVSRRLRQMHTVIGASLHLNRLFAAAQVDRFADSVYSAKIGLRF